MINYKTTKVIDVNDWDNLVIKTYGKVYNFQQQEGCQDRGNYDLYVSDKDIDDSNMPESIPEVVNGEEMGVRFSSWLARDPKQGLKDESKNDGTEQWMIDMWWERNFYPSIEVIANDLCKRGLIEAGEYTIDIDW